MNAKDIHRLYRRQQDVVDPSTYMPMWERTIDGLDALGVRFIAIKRGTKLPTKKRWNETKNTINGIQAKKYLANGHNISIAAGTGNELKAYLADFDRDAERGYECAQLAGGYYTHRSNAPHKAKFVFLSPDIIPTRLKSKSHGIDLLGLNSNGTHWQGVIAGIHDSGAPIMVGGHTLPVLPGDTVGALWEEWTGRQLFAPERSESDADTVYDADLAVVADAFEYADPHDPEMDYGSWIGIIAAVHDAFGDDALDLVIEWAEGKPGEVESKWRTFDREYTGKGATLKSLFYFARRNGWVDPTPVAAPLPEGATVNPDIPGHIILKTTPTPEPKPQPTVPAMTPSVVAKLANVLRGPEVMMIINRLGRIRDREGWRDFLIQLVTKVAPSQKGWVFDAGQDWMGEQFGTSGQAAGKKLHKMDSASLIHYLHTGKKEEGKAGRAKMRVDLQPLIAELWESCAKLENIVNPNTEFSNFNDDPPTNVHAVYSGAGQFADASMRALYKFAVARMGIPTVLARPLTASALTSLDYFVRHGEGTRAELVAEVGMSPGAAAGGTRVLEQLGLVQVEWEGPGTPKIYVLREDWEARLQYLIPYMSSYGARIRLVIRNYDRWIAAIERMLKTTFAPQMIHGLNERKRQLERTRKKWCIHGNKIGAYGRYAQVAA